VIILFILTAFSLIDVGHSCDFLKVKPRENNGSESESQGVGRDMGSSLKLFSEVVI